MPGMTGGFPSMKELNRRAIRGPVNPLDKSTVISIYPKPIVFRNCTLQPGRWELAAGSIEHPAFMTIGPSSWFKDVGPDEPLIEIVQSSVQIGESLVRDYVNGMFAVSPGVAEPGLFFIPGEINEDKLRGEYKNLLTAALARQMAYYRTLVKFADSLWARSNGNPLAINDEMRLAGKTLGSHDRDWMKDHANVGMVPCFACGEFKHPEYAICKACHSIDPNHPKAKFIQRADPFHGMTDSTAKGK